MSYGELVRFVLDRHLTLAVHAALLFATGLFVAAPVIWWRVRALQWLPLQLFRLIVRLMGEHPGLVRMTLIVWLFNSAAMFVYMASGFHPMLPKVFGIWVGMNVAIVTVVGGSERDLHRMVAPAEGGGWSPSPGFGWLCSIFVLALELPAFWYSLAMGISLGWTVQEGSAPYGEGLRVRALAFVCLVLPLLLLSALAESVALRSAGTEEGRGGRGTGDESGGQ